MATNLDLNDKLLRRVVKVGRFKSKKDAVNSLMAEYLRKKEQASILDLFGKVEYYPDYDYKKLRSRKPL